MMRKLQTSILTFGLLCLIGIQSAFSQINFKATSASNKAGTWTDIYTSNLGSGVSFQSYDDANSDNAENIGFNFDFNGSTYSTLRINTNGFLKLGSDNPSANNLFYSTANGTTGGVLSSTSAIDSNILSVFNHDLEPGASNNPYVYIYTTGNAGSRVCTIQWGGLRDKTTNPVIQFDEISFQIKLYEGSNAIEYVYGPFVASANGTQFKTVGVGLKGSNSNAGSLLVATKASTGAWNSTTFLDGNYTGNTHNVRNSVLPDSGRTYQFIPTYNYDLAITNVYSLGKMPVPFAAPHDLKVRVQNVGVDTISNFWVYLQVLGKNTLLDSINYSGSLAAGTNAILHYTNYSPASTGYDTIVAFTNADNNTFNNSKVWNQDVNLNSYSYTDISIPATGGVGFNGGTGDFVAKFNSSSANYINQIKTNFTTNNLNYQIGIWEVDTATGRPGANIWSSPTGNTIIGQAVMSVNPPVAVNGSFFVGVRQTGVTNVGFAFQFETPIRDSIFYYTAPTGGTTWTDFASLGTTNFRFMIEPRLMLQTDAGVIKVITPSTDTCSGGKIMDLTVQIQNLGVDTIDLTKDSIDVYAVVKDPSGNTTTYGPKTLNTGSLISSDTLDVTVTNNFDMKALGDYEIYAYTVWAKDSNYQNDTVPAVIRQSTGATAIANAIGNTTICNGDTALLNAGSSVNGIQFQWYFNGSAISNANDTLYYATVSGDYFCEVTNGYGCIANSDTISVASKGAASPTLIYNFAGYCPNDSVLITASTSANNYKYQWMLNGSPITNKTDSTIYVKSTGKYSVEVTDTITGCSVMSSDVNISAFNSPDTAVSFSGSNKICGGDSLNLIAVNAKGYSYQWYFNGNAISSATALNYYAKAKGTYTVEVTNATGCKASNVGVFVDVDVVNTTITTSSGKFFFCDADSLVLNAPAGMTSYQWRDAGGMISGANASSYVVKVGGTYSVTVTNSNGCKATSTGVAVGSSQSPVPSIKSVSNTQFCDGDSIKLEANSTASGYSYQWALNGSNVSNATGSTIYATAGGDYTLKITDSVGCAGESLPQSLIQLASPKPVASANNNTAICAGDSIVLDVTSQTSVQSIQWKLNASNISNATGNTLLVTTAGSYTAAVTGTNGCSGVSNAINVTVNPLPTATATYTNKTLSANTGTSLTYQWYKDGSPIAGATAATYAPTTNGKYHVVVTENGCDNKSNEITVTDIGFALVEFVNNLNVYPNPSKGLFTLNLDMNNSGKVRIRVVELTGRIISDETQQVNKGNNFNSIDLSGYAQGIYMLNIEMNGVSSTIKLVKE